MKKIFNKNFEKLNFSIFDDKPQLDSIIHVHQTHSNIVIEYTGQDISNIEADGIIFSHQYTREAFAIKTADCLPVIYIGKSYSAIIHAGWRGVENGILTHQDLAKVNPTHIFIGPSIQKNSFEVQEDFKKFFPMSSNFLKINEKLFFDLQQEATEQLQKTFPSAEIRSSHICTFEDFNYNSYRKTKTTKRNWNILKINEV